MFFKWVAQDSQGVVRSSCRPADSSERIVNYLQHMGYRKIFVSKTPSPIINAKNMLKRLCLKKSKVSLDLVYEFTSCAARLLDNELPLMDVIKLLILQTKNPMLNRLLLSLKSMVASGQTLSAALKKHPDFFSPFYCDLIALGERNGNLSQQFYRLKDYYESQISCKKKIKKAISYPLLVCSVAFFLLLGMFYFVVPGLSLLQQGTLGSSGEFSDLMAISNFLRENTGHFIVAFIILFLLFWFNIGTPWLKRFFHMLWRQLPIASKLTAMRDGSLWAYQVGVSLQCGSSLLDALSQTQSGHDTSPQAQRQKHIYRAVASGQTLHDSAQRYGAFCKRDLLLIHLGEQSTQLADMLIELAKLKQEELQFFLERCFRYLEPALLLTLSVITTSMIAAIYLPLLKLGQGIQ